MPLLAFSSRAIAKIAPPRILRSLGACVDHLADGRVMQVELSANFSQRVPIVDMRRSDALVPLGASQLLRPSKNHFQGLSATCNFGRGFSRTAFLQQFLHESGIVRKQ